MSYCLINSMMIAHVQDGQLVCSKYTIKLGASNSTQVYNFKQRLFFEYNGYILLEKEEDRDVLPTLNYRKQAKVLEGQGSVFSRIIQLAQEHGINCHLINAFKLSLDKIAYMFYMTHRGPVACQVLLTDKRELWGKTLLAGADRDVDYAGRNVVPIFWDEDFNVDDRVLGVESYTLTDDNSKMKVSIDM